MAILNITCIENQFNYGQRLQAYALQQYIRQQFGVDVIIADRRKIPYDFAKFESDCMHILHSDRFLTMNLDNIDTVIVGSDQTFTTCFYGKFIYLADYFNGKFKLVSYAGSANGNMKLNTDNIHYEKILKQLKNFKLLGFREDIDTEEVGVPNAEDSEIVASAMERMFKTAGGSGPCQSSYSIGPEGFSIFGCTRKCSEEPEHKCCKGGCKCKENKEKEELSPQEKEMLDAMMSSLPDILSEFEKVRRRYGK